jgi:hypothetical protein
MDQMLTKMNIKMLRSLSPCVAVALVVLLGASFSAGAFAQDGQSQSRSARPTQPQTQPKTFASAIDAVQALYAAVKSDDESAVRAILGGGPELINSGASDEEKLNRQRFVQCYDEMHRLVREPDGTTVLHVGVQNWPFPVPLVAKQGKWQFDADAGAQELAARQIGENEISAIRVCQRFVNSSDAEADSVAGPIREFSDQLAGAKADGPSNNGPFRGYYFRVVANDKSGSAMVAYPAEYRLSGIMTFIVTPNGAVYEKDLGKKTAKIEADAPKLEAKLRGKSKSGWVPVQ